MSSKATDAKKQNRELSFTEAANEALRQYMLLDSHVYIMGQGVNDQVGMFGLTTDLYKDFGEERVFDTPLSESGLMGIATGSAISGMHPVYFHNRPDFLLLTMDQIVNHASKYNFMSGGQCPVPMIIWAVTGQGWGAAAQHSQSLQGLFMHIPGLKIAMPADPYAVKGLIISALEDKNPVIFLDHRRLHNQKGDVPREIYRLPLGEGVIKRQGRSLTIVAISSMVLEAQKAADELLKVGIDVEIIDLRTIKPFDKELIIKSVRKTKKLLIADTGWKCCGVASELAACIYENLFYELECPIASVALPDLPTPAAYNLEDAYYNTYKEIFDTAVRMFKEKSHA